MAQQTSGFGRGLVLFALVAAGCSADGTYNGGGATGGGGVIITSTGSSSGSSGSSGGSGSTGGTSGGTLAGPQGFTVADSAVRYPRARLGDGGVDETLAEVHLYSARNPAPCSGTPVAGSRELVLTARAPFGVAREGTYPATDARLMERSDAGATTELSAGTAGQFSFVLVTNSSIQGAVDLSMSGGGQTSVLSGTFEAFRCP